MRVGLGTSEFFPIFFVRNETARRRVRGQTVRLFRLLRIYVAFDDCCKIPITLKIPSGWGSECNRLVTTVTLLGFPSAQHNSLVTTVTLLGFPSAQHNSLVTTVTLLGFPSAQHNSLWSGVYVQRRGANAALSS